MNNNTDMKSVVFGWLMLAGAYVLGRRHGREKLKSEVKDVMLKGFIEEKEKEKEAKGS